jgi:hypothetical protein
MTQPTPEPKGNTEEQSRSDDPFRHLMIMLGLYLLGTVAAYYVRPDHDTAFFGLLFVLPVGFGVGLHALLPSLFRGGFPPYLLLIGYPIFLALTAVITFAQSCWLRILGYLSFVVFLLVAIRGCAERVNVP